MIEFNCNLTFVEVIMGTKHTFTPWRNLIGATLLIASSIGLNGTGLTLFYEPVAQSLGFTQVQFSLYYTFTSISAMVLSPFIGKLFTKYRSKMRLILFISMLAHAMCLLAYSMASSLAVFYIISIIRGAAYSLTSGVPATLIVNSWFDDKRSTAQSILFVGPCIGSIAFMYLSRFFIEMFSWRLAYAALAAVNLLLIIAVMPLITDTPANLGISPYRSKNHVDTTTYANNTGFTFRAVLKMPSFWFFSVGVMLANLISFGVMQYMGPMLMTDGGWSSLTASNLTMVFNVFGSVMSVFCGWLADRVGAFKIMVVLAVLQIIAFLLIPGCNVFIIALLFVAILSTGNRLSSVFLNSIVPDIFGMKEYGSIYGLTSLFLLGGTSLGPILVAAIFDGTGSYIPVFIAGIIITVLFVPMTFIPYWRRLRGKMPFPEEISSDEAR